MHPPAADVPSLPVWTADWTWDPLVIAVLVTSTALYTRGALRMRERSGAIRPLHALAHGAELTIIAVALLSPLDHASDVLFSAHMAQHELLMLIAAPLVVLGRPIAPILWALPRQVRVRARRAARTRVLVASWRVVSSPVFALALHAAVRCCGTSRPHSTPRSRTIASTRSST